MRFFNVAVIVTLSALVGRASTFFIPPVWIKAHYKKIHLYYEHIANLHCEVTEEIETARSLKRDAVVYLANVGAMTDEVFPDHWTETDDRLLNAWKNC